MPLRSVLTVDEIVSSLERTSLPTILVEGRDDMTVYRWLEKQLGIHNANVLPCGGKEKLIAVFERRESFSHLKVVFLADKDVWLFTKVPEQYTDIIFTKGYSIENDILDSSVTIDLLTPAEKNEFNLLSEKLSEWFAFEIEEFRSGRDFHVGIHPNYIIPIGATELNLDAIAPRIFLKPKKRLVKSIYNNFSLRFRGKSLLELYVRLLSHPDRKSKYSKMNILEIGTKINGSNHMKRIIMAIKKKISRLEPCLAH